VTSIRTQHSEGSKKDVPVFNEGFGDSVSRDEHWTLHGQ